MRHGVLCVLLCGLALGAGAADAETGDLDPLLELLVEEGLITAEQAHEVQGRTEAESAEAPQAPRLELPSGLAGLKVGTLAYLSYQNGEASSGDVDRFTVKRGYVNITKKLTPYLSARVTPDAHQDSSGDFKLRLKYLYAKLHWDGSGLVREPYMEIGIAHMPWLDFEEHINRFRMQDTMFMERNGLFNSADVGVMFGANLGPELPESYTETVNHKYAGRWGSFQVGVFNGGGYHASEENSDKVLEGRLTLRPLPEVAPGLQLSLFGLDGKGNRADTGGVTPPDWQVLNAMLSYESPLLVATAQVVEATGNQKGTAVDAEGRAVDADGYSFFTEVRCPRHPEYSAFARFDRYDTDNDDPSADVRERLITGLAWQFTEGSYVVLDYDRLDHSLAGLDTEDRVQLTLQLKY